MRSIPYLDFLPSDLGRLTMRGFRFPRHLRALQAAVMRLMTEDDFNRLVVELPVRHGKSVFCSHVFLAWYLLAYPHDSVILATYQTRFSEEWSHKVSETIRQHGERLAGVTTSPGAGAAGKGANLILCDDLIKDMKEAANPARRHSLSTWFGSELMTRLEPRGKILMVMSRRHPDDLSGRCLDMNADLPERDRWHRITMPAIDESGAALWPKRWPVEKLLDIKRNYELAGQSYLFDSLYQQDPRGDSTLIEWPASYWLDQPGAPFSYDQLPPDLPIKWRLLSLDPSKGKSSKMGDYSAWADVTVDRAANLWCYPTLKVMPAEMVEDTTVELLSTNHYDALIVETNGFQEVIADNVARKCREKGVHCPLFKKCNTENKEVRIRLGLGPLLEQRRIRLCGRSTSYRLALSQLREFPTASHDDFADALNLACDLMEYLLTGRR
jgi:hypothetical protein